MFAARLINYLLIALVFLPVHLAVAETVLVVGVERNRYMPHYSFENGNYVGFARDLLDSFFTAHGYQYRYRPLPINRLFQSLLNGTVDFKYPDNTLWWADVEEPQNIVYSDPIVASIDGVSVVPEQKGRGIAAIKRLGTIRGFTPPNWLTRIKAGEVSLSENNSLANLLLQTLVGRVDGAYANLDTVQYALEKILKRPNALVFDEALPHNPTYYYLSSVKHPRIISEFNTWMRSNATLIEAIKEKYDL